MPVPAEDEAEHEAEPERVERDPDEHERRYAHVEQRPWPQRREEARRDGDQEPHDEPATTSESVTGAARPMRAVTGSRSAYERPRSPWRTMFQTKTAYSCGSEPWMRYGLFVSPGGGRFVGVT
jgi:hypothetical protein